ncbi:MAG: hypothetical protein D6796_04095, partial [Caldilineae bacterium]
MPKRYRTHLLVLSLYLLLTLALTWPWAAHFGDAFPGSATWAFDESTFVWNIWRFKHNLLDLRQSPLYTTDIFWPLGISLVLYTYNFLNALLGLPLLLAVNLPVAANTTLLLAYLLSGYGTYLLVRYLLPRHPAAQGAAFVAGAVYAFSASRAVFAALGHYDIVSTGFIPFFTLFFLKTLREPGWKNPALAGFFAALCLLAEMIFGVFLLFLALILLLFHHPPLWRRAPLRLLARLTLLGAVAAVLWGPVMLPILRAFAGGDFALQGWGESLKLSADLFGWFTPTALHPLWGSDWVARLRQVQEGTAPFSDVNTVFLGYGVPLLALVGFVAFRRQAKGWATGVVVFALFTLGPLLQIRGRFLFPLDNLLREQGIPQDVTFPMPFALLHYLPVIRANRVPARFSVVLELCLAVLVGFGVYRILGFKFQVSSFKFQVSSFKFRVSGFGFRVPGFKFQVRGWARVGASALLVAFALFDRLALPLPLTSAAVPDVYAKIGAEAGDFALLQLPLGWRNSFGVFGAERTQIQYYQHVHRKPMLGGNISRAPAFKFDYYRNIPLFQAIARTELPESDPPVDAETLARARAQAADLMTLYNVRYVVIHDPIPGRKPYEDTFAATRALVLDLLPLEPEPAYVSAGATAYRVQQPPIPNPLRLDFGDWPADPYRGEGWAANEQIGGVGANWAVGAEAQIFFPYRGTGDRRLSLRLTPFDYPGAPPQAMTLLLNGQPIGEQALASGWQVVEVPLPAEALRPGLNRLALRFRHRAAPRDVLPPQTAIGSTGAHTPVDIEVHSHADFAFITVGFGEEAVDASAHRRGFNVAVLDAASGAVLDKRGFDTAANAYEADALHDYLQALPDGRIVILSSQGSDAAAFLREGFGAVGGSAEPPPVPYALIGVKGAPPGTAAEATGEAYLRLGA